MFSSVNTGFYSMSRVSPGSSGGPGTPGPPPPGGGPRGVTRSKWTLGWGKIVFLSVFNSYTFIFTEQNIIFRDFEIMIFKYCHFGGP
jgi:hypothetical protein